MAPITPHSGLDALLYNTTGSSNTAVGYDAGTTLTAGNSTQPGRGIPSSALRPAPLSFCESPSMRQRLAPTPWSATATRWFLAALAGEWRQRGYESGHWHVTSCDALAFKFGVLTVDGSGSGLNLVSGPLQSNGAAGTSGNILVSQGSGAAPAWQSVATAVGGNYIQNTSTLQSGATFYVSSGTVNGQFLVAGNVGIGTTSPGAPLEINGNLAFTAGSSPTIQPTNAASGSGTNLIIVGGRGAAITNGGDLHLDGGYDLGGPAGNVDVGDLNGGNLIISTKLGIGVSAPSTRMQMVPESSPSTAPAAEFPWWPEARSR